VLVGDDRAKSMIGLAATPAKYTGPRRLAGAVA
jgi:hypothetical protein